MLQPTHWEIQFFFFLGVLDIEPTMNPLVIPWSTSYFLGGLVAFQREVGLLRFLPWRCDQMCHDSNLWLFEQWKTPGLFRLQKGLY